MKHLKTVLFLLLMSVQLFGQKEDDIFSKIRRESVANSQVMKTLSYLSDVHGSRLMGTPNYYHAALWAAQRLKQWGIQKTSFQSFDKGHRGWETSHFQVEMIEPTYSPLNAYPLAYTASTAGAKVGEVVYISSLDSIYAMEGQLKGKIVLLGAYYEPVSNVFQPFAQRLSPAVLDQAAQNPDPNDLIIGYHSRRSTPQVFSMQNLIRKRREQFFNFCKAQQVLALLEPSDYPYGILHADGNRAVPAYMRKTDITPIASFVIANEHFGRLLRLIKLGFNPKLKVNLEAKFYQEPKYNVNLISEIEGSDPVLKNELVIIGAHLDSWHAGTGAVDNASGCATMMEAMRILKAIDAKPKRTIRLALWGGEEQVFAGSAAYVEQHVGDLNNATPQKEQAKISAYFNLDNGAGKIRGIYLMANPAVKPIFEKMLQPFAPDNILTLQNANQTDHELFDFQNIPAFQFIQDPLDYMSAIHHTNADLYEYVPEKDQKSNAELVAYLAYQVAQAEELLPRKKFNSPVPSLQGNAHFQLKGFLNAAQVSLVSDFNNWNMFGTPLAKTKDGWECKLELPAGKYVYKYIVDGDWTADPATPTNQLVRDGKGHAGLTEIWVK
ncbi:MAG TPA: M20/M25/M40 family metallo-hydrolase [Haliscomenobacter sp.]|uniref:M20/M25/M40 family metallo-hydrolase n=1 Tax=Haliscomenobacter sp. TaxID=2717303 RepID=UPI002CE01056|nr:M20/M25/M40 family metallo-hydrolase [Haliscomenobacter sp.]HOY19729.1 M20/M25/M40 family metallo-hydrolase [Haliscomenobacter sp.]